jgi:hypothetical protein
MSFIRQNPVKQETCPHCNGYGVIHRQEALALTTAAEYESIFGYKPGWTLKKTVPKDFEICTTGPGSPHILETIREAIDYCREYGVPGVAFEFNGEAVLVDASTDAELALRAWWKAVFNETPEESAAKR